VNKKSNKKLSYLHIMFTYQLHSFLLLFTLFKVNAFWVRYVMAACRNISLEVLAVIHDNQRQEFFASLCTNNFCYSIDTL